jgi:predicted RecA/RadA family phage recombinase
MAYEADFRGGLPLMVPYTAGADIDAGDMVLVGNTTGWTLGVAHHPIANGVTSDLSAGGGWYDCMVASNYAAGSKVYKPAGNAILTTTSTNNALFGFTLEAAAAANAVVKVLHKPYV